MIRDIQIGIMRELMEEKVEKVKKENDEQKERE